jgi:hypothetical protein
LKVGVNLSSSAINSASFIGFPTYVIFPDAISC